jgi:hypothetical protein
MAKNPKVYKTCADKFAATATRNELLATIHRQRQQAREMTLKHEAVLAFVADQAVQIAKLRADKAWLEDEEPF